MRPPLLSLAVACALLAGTVPASAQVQQRCPERLGVVHGDTLTHIARRCGVSVARLRQANPGLDADTLRAGMRIAVPRAHLPSPTQPGGGRLIEVLPGQNLPSGSSSPSTVILPPQPPRIPQQHIIVPGFNDRPGQLPHPHHPQGLRPR